MQLEPIILSEGPLTILPSGILIDGKPINYLNLEGPDFDLVKRLIKPYLDQSHYNENKFELYFTLFKIYYKREYPSAQMERKRFANFKNNLEIINSTNARNESFQAKINKFADSDPTPLPGLAELDLIPEREKQYFPENGLFSAENEQPSDQAGEDWLMSQFEREMTRVFGQNDDIESDEEKTPNDKIRDQTYYQMDNSIRRIIRSRKGKSNAVDLHANDLKRHTPKNEKLESIQNNLGNPKNSQDDQGGTRQTKGQLISNALHNQSLDSILSNLKKPSKPNQLIETQLDKSQTGQLNSNLIELWSRPHSNLSDLIGGVLGNKPQQLDMKNPILIISQPEKVSIIKDSLTDDVKEIRLNY